MATDLDAIYENGAFRPIGEISPPLTEGTRVRLMVEAALGEGSQKIVENTQKAADLSADLSKASRECAVSLKPKQGNGLADLAGGWTDEQWEAFEQSVAMSEQVDEELWQ